MFKYIETINKIFPECKYKNWYISLILKAIHRQNSIIISDDIKNNFETLRYAIGYFEYHHILPIFMCKNINQKKDIENIVSLTAREHFIAHKILWKILKTKESFYAYFCLAYIKTDHQERYKLTSREFNYIREIRLSYPQRKHIGENHHNYGKKLNEETRKKISNTLKGRKLSKETIEKRKISLKKSGKKSGNNHHNYGKKLNEDYKEKIRESCKLVKKTDEWNKKNSISNTGRIHIANTITKERKRPKKDIAEKIIEESNGVWIKWGTGGVIPDYTPPLDY